MLRKRLNEHISNNYHIYLDNAKYYYKADPVDITNTCILFILQKPDYFLEQLINDKKPADKYIKCKTGLDLYLLRTIKINAIHKTSPYQQLVNNEKLIITDKVVTNETDKNDFEADQDHRKYPDIIYIVENKLGLTWYQKNLFLAVTGIKESEWLGLTGLSMETNGLLKISTISFTYNKVFNKLKKYILEHYQNPFRE